MRLRSPWTPRLAQIEASAAEKLVRALTDDILGGRLASGDRLPAHRDLAWALKIGVGTVTKAYAVLERRGLTRSIKGRGTFVAAEQARHGPLIDLSVNIPPTMIARRLLARSLAEVARKVDADHFNLYSPPMGHAEHRRLLSRWLATFGLNAGPASLVLTGGGQQALALAFDLTCGREGVILTERLTYPGAIALCRHRGYRMLGVAIDHEGIVPSSLAAALDAAPSIGRKAVYMTPTLHNPTTATMSLDRRQAIVDLCRARGAWIIEDGVYATGTEGKPPLAALAPECSFYVGSLSKTLSPGLKVGVLVVPPGMEQCAEVALQAFPLSPSPLSCEVVGDWLANGLIDSLRMGLREEALRRARLAASLLREQTLICHPGAYHAWLPMPRHVASQFSVVAASLGIAVTPPEAVMVDPEEDDSGIRLCLCGPPLDVLTKALTLLSGVGHFSTRSHSSLIRRSSTQS